jgi:hypothetical protein
VRRLVVFAIATVAATAAAVAVGAAPAGAHICQVPVQIPVGQPATAAIGVTVENATVTDVEVGLPAGLRLDRVYPKAGWKATRSGSTVHYTGGIIASFTCEYFSLGVTATTKGAFGITVVQRTATGTVVARSIPDPTSPNSQVLDQFVYAGVEPPKRPSTSSGPSVATIGGIALVGFGIVMFAGLWLRARRARRVDARLEEFKKRTPDPPPEE